MKQRAAGEEGEDGSSSGTESERMRRVFLMSSEFSARVAGGGAGLCTVEPPAGKRDTSERTVGSVAQFSVVLNRWNNEGDHHCGLGSSDSRSTLVVSHLEPCVNPHHMKV